jgi:hypothetical protein
MKQGLIRQCGAMVLSLKSKLFVRHTASPALEFFVLHKDNALILLHTPLAPQNFSCNLHGVGRVIHARQVVNLPARGCFPFPPQR